MADVAPGFVDLEHLFSQLIDNASSWQQINDAVTQTAQIHAELLDAMLNGFSEQIDPSKPQFMFKMPVSVEMQPLQGEDDSPVPVRGWDRYQMAAPLFDVGLAWANNRKSRAKMTVGDANEFTVNSTQADSRWQRRQMMAALFTNTQYTFEDPEHGTLTVKPLANGDSDEFNNVDGETYTDSHYIAQAAAIDSSNYPFEDLHDELMEHPTNGGEVVCYIPPTGGSGTMKTTIRALPDFIGYRSNGRVQEGSGSTVLTDFPSLLFPQAKPLGWLEDSDVYIATWDAVPANYGLAIPTITGKKLLARRDEPEAALQGLRVETNSNDGNHYVQRLLRTRGFSVFNRIAAAVLYIGSGTYAIPSGMTAPQN